MQEKQRGQAPQEEMDLSEILRIRREKLYKLQQEGADPYRHTRF